MLKLGIVYNQSGKMINHRSLLKVLFNPLLRRIGFFIGTPYDTNTKVLGLCILQRGPINKPLINNFKNSWLYELEEGAYIKKERRWI